MLIRMKAVLRKRQELRSGARKSIVPSENDISRRPSNVLNVPNFARSEELPSNEPSSNSSNAK